MFDPKCDEIAEYFLSDEPWLQRQTDDLAQHIQDAIETWIAMERDDRKQAETRAVEAALVGKVICDWCGATLDDFAERCAADLLVVCPGFVAIERAKAEFARNLATRPSQAPLDHVPGADEPQRAEAGERGRG
jgi:hypothetical protein